MTATCASVRLLSNLTSNPRITNPTEPDRDALIDPVVDKTEVEDLITRAVDACVQVRRAAVALTTLAEEQLRRVREAGRLLSLVQRSDGGRPLKNSSAGLTSYRSALQQAGISRTTANVWRRVWEVPEADFDQFLKDAPALGRALTIAELLRTVTARSEPAASARTVTVGLSEADHRAFEHRLNVLGAAYFTQTRGETLMAVLERAYQQMAGLADRRQRAWWVITASLVPSTPSRFNAAMTRVRRSVVSTAFSEE